MANNLTWGGARGFNLKITFVTSCSLGSSSCSFVCLCVCEIACVCARVRPRARAWLCACLRVCVREVVAGETQLSDTYHADWGIDSSRAFCSCAVTSPSHRIQATCCLAHWAHFTVSWKWLQRLTVEVLLFVAAVGYLF